MPDWIDTLIIRDGWGQNYSKIAECFRLEAISENRKKTYIDCKILANMTICCFGFQST